MGVIHVPPNRPKLEHSSAAWLSTWDPGFAPLLCNRVAFDVSGPSNLHSMKCTPFVCNNQTAASKGSADCAGIMCKDLKSIRENRSDKKYQRNLPPRLAGVLAESPTPFWKIPKAPPPARCTPGVDGTGGVRQAVSGGSPGAPPLSAGRLRRRPAVGPDKARSVCPAIRQPQKK